MNKTLTSLIAVLCISSFSAFNLWAAGSGDSDIILAQMKLNSDSQFEVTRLSNISNREGYDNQPAFSKDGKTLFYTAMYTHEGKTQTDIMAYDIKIKQARNITLSEVSEYSPTPMNANDFTAVVVERDNKQRIWSYAIQANRAPRLVNAEMEPVGYFAWGEKKDVTMFILGEPHTLQYLQQGQQKATVVDSDIGRSVKKMPRANWFSYIKEGGKSPSKVMGFDANTPQETLELIELPKGAEYFNWHPEQWLFSANKNVLVAANYSDWPAMKTKSDWQAVINTSSVCSGVVTRIAVSDDGSQIAFVCQWPLTDTKS